MLNAAALHALDSKLSELLSLLTRGTDYGAVAAYVLSIMESVTAGVGDRSKEPHDNLLPEGWERNWDSSEYLGWGWFGDPEHNRTDLALLKLFVEMARFACSATVAYHKQKYRVQLCDPLSEYLALRGYPIPGSEGAEDAAAPRDQGGVGQGEGDDRPPPDREGVLQAMKRSIRLAYLAFDLAEHKASKRLTYREAHKLLREEGIPGQVGEDYELPPANTFCRYVSEALRLLGEPRHTRREGRPLGRSIVRQQQIEQPERDE
jgi:hypothetical protein